MRKVLRNFLNTPRAEGEPSVRATLRLWLITLMLVLFNLSMMRLG